MSQMQPINYMNNTQNGIPIYNYGTPAQPSQPQQQTVAVSAPNSSQIYQYPQASLYNDPNKQAASGVNIYIYNPSAIGGPNTNNVTQIPQPVPQVVTQPTALQPIANTPITENTETPKTNKTKRIVELTDDYIKRLEDYLKNPDKQVRNIGIRELVKRYEEEDSRYDDPALTALLNIALQDPNPDNRLLAMSVISSGGAHGDATTVKLLDELQKSDAIHGQEAAMAGRALIRAQETPMVVPDNSPDKPTIIYKYE